MPVPVITKGATTDHGGEISECEPSFTVHGKGVHLEGMQHYCPDCDETVSAVASNHTKTVFGKAMILEGDVATCGAKFISAQNVASVGGGGAVGSASYSNNDAIGMPNEKMKYDAQFRFVNDDGIPYADTDYIAINVRTQEELTGTTDEEGWTKELFSDEEDEFIVHLCTAWHIQ